MELGEGQDLSNQGGDNPNWGELMSLIPEDRHSDAQGILSKWDNNYNEVQSKYKDWDQFVEGGYTPDEVNMALGALNAIANQPEEVLAALQDMVNEGQSYDGNQQDQSQQTQEPYSQGQGQSTEQSYDITSHPEFVRLNGAVQTMAEILSAQREQEEEEAENAAIDNELEEAKGKFGDYTQYGDNAESFVIGQMLQGRTAEEAVQNFFQFVQGASSQARRLPPQVLGPSGSIPNPTIDPKTLDTNGRRKLIADILAEAQGQ